jgi:putative Holliday junction resolvase
VTRLLGIDLGERRIGLALAEDGGRAMPHATIRRGRTIADDIRSLERAVGAASIDAVVVGLPVEASGAEGDQARRTRSWAEALAGAQPWPVVLRDERLTSHVAETRVGPMPRGRSGGPPSRVQRDRYRERIDREAAAIILQDELDARELGSRGEPVIPGETRA